MQIVNKKPIPMYEVKCHECGSVFQYKKSEVPFTGFINCPVCGCSNWANTTLPVYNSEEQNNDESTMNQWIPCSERLPEQGKPVLVTYIYNGKRFVAESWYIGQHDERGNPLFSSCADEYKASDLYFQKIAWMPLPDPWRGEQE